MVSSCICALGSRQTAARNSRFASWLKAMKRAINRVWSATVKHFMQCGERRAESMSMRCNLERRFLLVLGTLALLSGSIAGAAPQTVQAFNADTWAALQRELPRP